MMTDFSYWKRQQTIWELPVKHSSERLLMLAIAYHQGDNDEAWPSQDTLAAELGLKDRQTRTLIARLQKRGWITVRRAWPNRYSICWDRLPETGTPLPDSAEQKRHSTAGQKRHSTADSRRRNRHSGAIEHPACEHPKNTHADGASSKRNGWSNGGIQIDELRKPEAIEKRFREAVERDYCGKPDRLRFFTLAAHVADSSKARNPGALFTKLLKGKEWPGSDAQEDAARQMIRTLDRDQRPVNERVRKLTTALTADLPAGGRDDD